MNLTNEEDSEKYEEQTNIALMALTYSDTESDWYSRSVEEEDEVLSKLSCVNLITLIQDIMGRCQEKSRYMKFFKKAIWFTERWVKIFLKLKMKL